MALDTWLGGTDTDFNVAANWLSGIVPADADGLLFNHQAQQGCLVNCDAGTNGKTFDPVIVTSGYNHGLGANGDELDPTAITNLHWESKFEGTSYIKGTITDGSFSAPNASAGTVELNGVLGHLSLNGGHLHLTNGAALTDTDKLLAIDQSRGIPSKVTIDAGVTLTGSIIDMIDGQIISASTIIGLRAHGGRTILRGSAAGTLLVLDGNAILDWDSTGTVAMFHASDASQFRSLGYTRAKTLTEGHIYGKAICNLSGKGGVIITITNHVRVHGENSPIFAVGAKVTAS